MRHPPGREPERAWVLDVLLREFLGFEVERVVEARADTAIAPAGEEARALRLAEGLLGVADEDWLKPESLPRPPFARLDTRGGPFAAHPEDEVALLYGGAGWSEDADGIALEADLLGGTFFCLSRYEELVVPDRDEHGRFPARAAVAGAHGLLDRPLVNEWLELLWLALARLWPRLERRTLVPEVLPSHDVDWPRSEVRGLVPSLRRAARELVRDRDPSLAARRLAAVAGGADPNDTFDALMDASERRGLRSAFYFIADHPAGTIDGDYSLDDPWIVALLRRIHERGHEVGLHASYTTFDDAERTRGERETLRAACAASGIEQDAWGGRQHYLRWTNPQTWRNWDEAGLDYDSTLGWADELGFRCGVCLDYPAFDVLRRRPLRLRERPLVAMDVAVLDRLGLSGDAAAARLASLRRTCARYGGRFTLLWHNSRLLTRAERSLYEAALG